MAATLGQIARYLENRDWKYMFDPSEERIVTGVMAENLDKLLIFITLQENGEYLELAAPQLLQGVQEHIYKGILFQTLLAISWETKMLRWQYDRADGEVRASIGFPLEDSLLTESQFNRCLDGLIQLVDSTAMPRLKAVLEAGEDPAEKEMGERLLLTLQEILPPGSLDMLSRAIAARQERGAA